MKSDSATNIKNNFGAYLDRVKRGEIVVVLEYGRPVAQLTKPLASTAAEFGLAALEREGLASLPQKQPLEPAAFLADRIPLKREVSLLATLLSEREESR